MFASAGALVGHFAYTGLNMGIAAIGDLLCPPKKTRAPTADDTFKELMRAAKVPRECRGPSRDGFNMATVKTLASDVPLTPLNSWSTFCKPDDEAAPASVTPQPLILIPTPGVTRTTPCAKTDAERRWAEKALFEQVQNELLFLRF